MDACCHEKEEEIASLQGAHGRALRIVLAINATFFAIELCAGILAHSTALLADSLDMLGDSLVYGLSLYVLSRSPKWKVSAAMAKGVIMIVFGIGVMIEAVYKALSGQVPGYETIGIIGLLALLANAFCFILLYRHRGDNLNLRSTWLCSRNDVIANAAVLVAALGVYLSKSLWPDVIIGVAIAALFLKSASTVLRESILELRTIRMLESHI
jgi:cation diffusion facilitator family transporter